MHISILRLGHRIFRDQRITTHCALTARALGATAFFYTGQRDSDMEASVKKAVKNWGGPFSIRYVENGKKFLKKQKSTIVHLTVYGLPFHDKVKELKKQKNLLVVVGGEKVPPEIYQQADYNLAVGQQPHSEVAALGIFLHALNDFTKTFTGAQLRVVPQTCGKLVRKRSGR